jgi:peptidoglycan hydrolase-like protein with peptidoglycan-binding domain
LAAKSCHINTDGPDKTPDTADDNRGVKPRNEMNKILYTSAGIKSLDKTKLHGLWPRDKKALQTALNASGMGFKLKVDGVVGPKTKAALEAFQAAHGLVVDGIAGPVTWGHLDELRQG